MFSGEQGRWGEELSEGVVSDGVWPQPDLRGALEHYLPQEINILSSCVNHYL